METIIFSKELFNNENFSIDSFISDYRRRNVPLENLLSDIKKYGSSLESELLELINKDYTDFVNLSANLSGIDKVIDNLRTPMLQMRKEIQSVKDIVTLVRSDFEAKLSKKKQLSEKKKLLHLFTSIHQIVCKIESLLFVSESPQSQPMKGEGMDKATVEAFQKTSISKNKDEETSNLIQRVANDFNQLKYYVSCCSHYEFVRTMQFRIERIETMMKEILEKLFVESIQLKDHDIIANCLRTYVAIDRINEAEELFKSRFVLPFLSSVITAEKVEKEGIERIYAQTIDWIKSECIHLFEVARSVKGFDFLTNSIFSAIVFQSQNQQKMYGPIGIPDLFHANFLISLKFLENFESFFSSISEIKKFRSNLHYAEFLRRWNLSIYFGIRFQEISKHFHESLSFPPLLLQNENENKTKINYESTEKLESALKLCWSKEKFLELLSDSFFKLSLQLIARYIHWIDEGISTLLLPSSSKVDDLPDSNWAKTITNEEALSALYFDNHYILNFLPTEYMNYIESETNHNLHPKLYSIFRESYLNNDDLKQCNEKIASIICKKIIDACITSLVPVRGIMQTFRMTNKAAPTHPSYYVRNILEHLRKFLALRSVSSLPSSVQFDWKYHIIHEVTSKYCELVVEMLETVEKQTQLLLKMRKNMKGNDEGVVKGEDNIAIQLDLDVKEFGKEIASFNISFSSLVPYQNLCSSYQHKLPKS